MLYKVQVEAKSYGEATSDGEAFMGAVERLAFEPEPMCGHDEAKGMLSVTFEFDSSDAREAHEAGLELWEGVWEDAFPDMAPTAMLAVRAVPVDVPAVA